MTATTSNSVVLTNWGVVDYLAQVYAAAGDYHAIMRIASHALPGAPADMPVYRVEPAADVDLNVSWMVFDKNAVALYQSIRAIARETSCFKPAPEAPEPVPEVKPTCRSCAPVCPPKVQLTPDIVLPDVSDLPAGIANIALYQPDEEEGFAALTSSLIDLGSWYNKFAPVVEMVGALLLAMQGTDGDDSDPDNVIEPTPPLNEKITAAWLGTEEGVLSDMRRNRLARAFVQTEEAKCLTSTFDASSCSAAFDGIVQALDAIAIIGSVEPATPSGGGGTCPCPEIGEYTHVQDTPALVWNIQHGLNEKFPNVIIVDDEGNQVLPVPVWATATTSYLQLSFGLPTAGIAVLRG